ncbi:MAG: helix-turn-helix transcriptional regulator [Patescibacteria group bacterium]
MPSKIKKINLNDNYSELNKLINSQEYIDYNAQDDMLLTLRVRIKQIIERKKLTQEQLASKMGVKQPQLSRLVSGKGGFSWKTLEKFCIATGTKLDLK